MATQMQSAPSTFRAKAGPFSSIHSVRCPYQMFSKRTWSDDARVVEIRTRNSCADRDRADVWDRGRLVQFDPGQQTGIERDTERTSLGSNDRDQVANFEMGSDSNFQM